MGVHDRLCSSARRSVMGAPGVRQHEPRHGQAAIPHRHRGRQPRLRRCVHPHLGPREVGEVTPAMIDALYAMLRVRGSQRGGALAAGTIARVHVVVRSAFSQAQRWGWVWDNPAEWAHRIVVPPTEMRPPTPAELGRLLDHVQLRDPVFHVLVLLAAMTGARRAQLLGLRWSDVHHDARRVSFCRGWVQGEESPVVAPTKTKLRHSVEISANTHRALMAIAGEANAAHTLEALLAGARR
jgi:integrase